MPDAYYNEWDKHAAGWLRNLVAAGLICPGDVDDRDIRDVCPDDLRGYTQVHLFAGIGLWSHALRMAGWSDDRHLWPAAHWLIGNLIPGIVFGEQVASPDGLAWLDIVSADLEACGYACGAVDFPSAGVGAPNIRQRLFWVADANSDRRDIEPRGTGQQKIARCGRSKSDNGCRLGDAESTRLPHAGAQELPGTGWRSERREPEPSGCADNPWRVLEWIGCRDGKARPAQPGIFPLAPRHPGDVAKLRAYGNAINPWVASEVIAAWLRCVP